MPFRGRILGRFFVADEIKGFFGLCSGPHRIAVEVPGPLALVLAPRRASDPNSLRLDRLDPTLCTLGLDRDLLLREPCKDRQRQLAVGTGQIYHVHLAVRSKGDSCVRQARYHVDGLDRAAPRQPIHTVDQ